MRLLISFASVRSVSILSGLAMVLVFFSNAAMAENVCVVNFPEKITTQDVYSIPKVDIGRIEAVEVGRFTSIESLNLSNEQKYTLKNKGYTKAVINIFGFVRSPSQKECRVGTIMMPDEEEIVKAWRISRYFALTEEVQITVGKTKQYFHGKTEFDLSFEKYLFGFYNTCDSNVNLSVYYYLK